MRRRMPERKDRKVFKRTAVKAKKVNIDPTVYRGGYRM